MKSTVVGGRVPRRTRQVTGLLLLVIVMVVAPAGIGASAADISPDATQTTVIQTGLPSASDVYGPKCDVTNAQFLGPGGNQDWSPVTNRLAYNAIDANGLYQVYTSNPDGSDVHCITCVTIPNGPRADRNKFNPKWDPTGQYLVMQVEYSYHPLAWKNTSPHIQEELLNAVWSDLWVTDANGSRWTRLTNTRSDGVYGVLDPVWSRDGTKMFWSELLQGPSLRYQFGTWQLKLADYSMTNGVAALSNVQDITPSTGNFFESHAFTPDGSSVIFTSDLALPGRWRTDIWEMNLQTGALTELSDGGHWNEHADYTPDGLHLTYMSTEPYQNTFMRAELLMTDPSGGQVGQLTYFNVPGHLESVTYPVMVVRASWSSDGTKLLVTLQRSDTYPNREMWMLTFAGQCGI